MKTKKRVLCILLSLALVLGLIPEMSLTAYAADFYFEDCILDVELYPSGCLKSMNVKIVPEGNYAEAYGKIAIHSQATQYTWENRLLNVGQSDWSNVNTETLKSTDGLRVMSFVGRIGIAIQRITQILSR